VKCIKGSILGAALALALGGCSTSSHVLLGTPRSPIPPEQVRVYTVPPARYEQIASINANSSGSLALTGQQNMDKAIERMKAEAAKLGANGILLQGVSDAQTGSIGTGVGSSSYGPHSSFGGGVGGSFALTSKVTQGLAIYVPADQSGGPAAPFPLMAPPPPPPPGTGAAPPVPPPSVQPPPQ
jgi:uncharacterized protein YbjQ (UPF0145 family)